MKFRDTNLKRALKNLIYPMRKNIVVLEPHLGLGDNLICLGLIRALSRREPDTHFYLACLHRCYPSLAWMFQDLDNIFLFAVESGREARQLAGFFNARYLPIGIENVDLLQFDRFFYEQHGVPLEERWSNCQVPPGPQSEALFASLNPDNEPYFLVCDTQSEFSRYDLEIQNPLGRKVIELAPLTNNIYDWTKLALFAQEIHTIDTAFVHFIESTLINAPAKPLFYHLARASQTQFTRRLPWQVIQY